MTADLPERPHYFVRDAEINRTGATPLEERPEVPALDAKELARQAEAGMLVLDTRPASKFLAAHIPGSLHIGLGGQFATWAGALLGVDTMVLLVAEDDEALKETSVRLARVGLEGLCGYLRGGILAWEQAGLPLRQIAEISVEEMARRQEAFTVLDVRRPAEWNSGHIGGAIHVPLDQLFKRMSDLPRNKPIAVQCQGGYRSAIGASILNRDHRLQVLNVEGGFSAWTACQLPVQLESE